MVNSGGTLTEAFVSEGDWTPLSEAAYAEDGTLPIKIIGPGWSKNGRYYSEAMLRRDVGRYTAGTKDFWNHPGPVAAREQPSGDLNALASVLTEDARYLDEGVEGAFDGPGIYTRVRPLGDYKDRIREMAPYIGVSHRVNGTQKRGEAEGRRGMLVESIDEVVSVDYVATPAAGGRPFAEGEEEVESMTDSIEEQVAAAVAPLTEAVAAKDAEIATLTEQVAALTTENDRLMTAATLAEASGILAGELAKASIPEPAKARVGERVTIVAESFDADAYRAAIVEAVAAEAAYVAAVAGPQKREGTGVAFAEGEGDAAYDELRALRRRR